MPTRFKYTPVQPQSFALTPAEILMATDVELNQYLSVKKYAPYRKDNNWDKTRGNRLKELKTNVAERSMRAYGIGMGGGGSNQGVNAERVKKRKGKKERLKMRAAEDTVGGEDGALEIVDRLDDKRKHEMVDTMHEAQGDSPPKKKRRRHRKTTQE
jgi:protein KRI1